MRRIILLLLLSFFSWSAFACKCKHQFVGINDLKDLERYAFIAHLKVTSLEDEHLGVYMTHKLKFNVIELFKGKAPEFILNDYVGSSCPPNTRAGEEWILFGIESEGKMYVQACDRNCLYRTKEGARLWMHSHSQHYLQRLRELYGHEMPKPGDGKHLEKFPNGKTELEETYLNGILEGKRRIWHINGKLQIEENYMKGKLEGVRKTWHNNGKIESREFYTDDKLQGAVERFYASGVKEEDAFYRNDTLINIHRFYYDTIADYIDLEGNKAITDSVRKVQHRIQVQYERIYDEKGNELISREYYQTGVIAREEITDRKSDLTTIIYYHSNGMVSSILYNKNGKDYGHYTEFDEKGNITKSWEYNENGDAPGK